MKKRTQQRGMSLLETVVASGAMIGIGTLLLQGTLTTANTLAKVSASANTVSSSRLGFDQISQDLMTSSGLLVSYGDEFFADSSTTLIIRKPKTDESFEVLPNSHEVVIYRLEKISGKGEPRSAILRYTGEIVDSVTSKATFDKLMVDYAVSFNILQSLETTVTGDNNNKTFTLKGAPYVPPNFGGTGKVKEPEESEVKGKSLLTKVTKIPEDVLEELKEANDDAFKKNSNSRHRLKPSVRMAGRDVIELGNCTFDGTLLRFEKIPRAGVPIDIRIPVSPSESKDIGGLSAASTVYIEVKVLTKGSVEMGSSKPDISTYSTTVKLKNR